MQASSKSSFYSSDKANGSIIEFLDYKTITKSFYKSFKMFEETSWLNEAIAALNSEILISNYLNFSVNSCSFET